MLSTVLPFRSPLSMKGLAYCQTCAAKRSVGEQKPKTKLREIALFEPPSALRHDPNDDHQLGHTASSEKALAAFEEDMKTYAYVLGPHFASARNLMMSLGNSCTRIRRVARVLLGTMPKGWSYHSKHSSFLSRSTPHNFTHHGGVNADLIVISD